LKAFFDMITFLLRINQSVRFTLVILYVGCIVALSLLPPQAFPKLPLFAGFDKVIHFTMYFIFSMLLCWSVKTELKYMRLFLIIPVTIGWGVFMEIMQYEMHLGRSFELYDILANSIGVIVGVIFYIIVTRKSHS